MHFFYGSFSSHYVRDHAVQYRVLAGYTKLQNKFVETQRRQFGLVNNRPNVRTFTKATSSHHKTISPLLQVSTIDIHSHLYLWSARSRKFVMTVRI